MLGRSYYKITRLYRHIARKRRQRVRKLTNSVVDTSTKSTLNQGGHSVSLDSSALQERRRRVRKSTKHQVKQR